MPMVALQSGISVISRPVKYKTSTATAIDTTVKLATWHLAGKFFCYSV